MSELTASDVLALTRDGDKGFLEGNGIIILILFFLMFGNGFWNGNGGNIAAQESLTRAELYEGLNTQDVKNSISGISNQLCSGFADITNAMNAGFSGIQAGLCNGFNSVNSGIANLGYQMSQCCCDIKTALHSEGEATRSLIQQNTIQQLRDTLADKDREILATGLVAAQTAQTNNLENFMRSLVNGCSCGC